MTACQKEMHEYGDQNVTKVLDQWKISFDKDAISQQHLVGKVFSREGKCQECYKYMDNNCCIEIQLVSQLVTIPSMLITFSTCWNY